jgi:transcriptional regulator with XRE-family HTH domain
MGVKELGNAIRAARESVMVAGKPLSQLLVASDLGLSQSTVAKYEAGEVGVPNPDILRKMATLYGADLLHWYSLWLGVRWPDGSWLATDRDADHLAAEIRAVLEKFRAGGSGSGDERRIGGE